MTETLLLPNTLSDASVSTRLPTAAAGRKEKREGLRIGMLAACPFPANHGTPGAIREMSEALVEEGHDVHIVTYHFGEDIDVQGPSIHRIPPLTNEATVIVGPTVRRPLYDLQMVFTAVRVARKYGLDVLHAHGYEAALAAWLCRLATGIPIVYSGHNTMADELPSYEFIRPAFLAKGLASVLDMLVPRLANRCLPHSENIRQFFCDKGLSKRTDAVVNFGIEIPEVTDECRSLVRETYAMGTGPVIVYAGVMDRFQRLDLLLEAMVTIVKSVPDSRLLMVRTIQNDRQFRALRDHVDELGIGQAVIFTEPQQLPEVRRLLAASDIAVVPRPQTPGFPIKLLNYMSARKPTVLFSSSASGLTHGENAFLVSEDTSAALADGILTLLQSEELCEHIGQRGYDFVRQHHDRRVVARQVFESYQRAIEAATCRRSLRAG